MIDINNSKLHIFQFVIPQKAISYYKYFNEICGHVLHSCV